MSVTPEMTPPVVAIVDDEAFFRQVLADLLAAEGYQLELFSNGEDAMARIRQGGVDLVLTDMVMPGISGLDLLTGSRTLPNPPDVILITGHASLETAIKALKSGARDYLVKPFDHDELLHTVHNTLDQRRLLEENSLLKRNIRLFQAGQSLASLLSTEPLMRQAVSVLVRELGGGWGMGLMFDEAGVIRLPVVQGINGKQASAIRERAAAQWETIQEQSVVPWSLPTAFWKPLGLAAPGQMFLLPLRTQGELKGGIILAPDRSPDSENAQQDLLYLAEEAAIGFDNAFRYEHARELMYTDDLTGLYNHRYLQVALDKEIRRSKRYGLKFSLIFIDLDRFKQINDRHGHLVGSAVLTEMGQVLRRCSRDADVICRFGGDEFAILLLETDPEGVRVVAERIRSAIESHLFLEVRKPACRVTATVGYATFPVDATDQQGLLDLADQAMYAGKRTRNVSCSPKDIIPGQEASH